MNKCRLDDECDSVKMLRKDFFYMTKDVKFLIKSVWLINGGAIILGFLLKL